MPKIISKEHVPVNESNYTIHVDFASYDPLPSIDNIVDALNNGIRDEFPNCSINITEARKDK